MRRLRVEHVAIGEADALEHTETMHRVHDLRRRVWQHRGQIVPGFTDRYNLTQLVWFEHHAEPTEAIRRGKALKRWNRAWKLDLIAAANPGWRDLWEDIAAG